MVPAWLCLLCLFIPQAFPGAQPAEVYVDVPENYGGNFPLYLTKLPLPRKETEGQIVLSGDSGVAAEGPFAVDPQSGFLLVTRALDREEQAEYQLQVTLETEDGHVLWGPQHVLVHVKDENDQASGHQATATVDVSIVENTWVPLDPVHLAENLQVPYPHHIAQVHWSGGDVHYHLESQPLGPFDVDKEGKLYVTRELDREAQAEYLLRVRAQNTRGEDYPAEPLELHVVVMDENDNMPVCPPRGPAISIPELSPPGTKVAKLSAEDADAPGSPNSHVVYRLLSPEPEEGAEGRAFELDSTSGSVTLGAAPLQAGQNILLQVLVIDLGGAEGGLSSTCEIAVTITDINDHAPEFTTSQIEPLSLPEDTEPGTLVTTLMATDADLEPAFRLMDFAIEAGDVEGTFGLDWEPDSGRVQLRLLKNLSYEAAPSHKLVVVVRSVAEPVGPDPGPGATVTVTVLVERVTPPPQLDQESYEASVPVSTPAGSLLLTIRPSDPMSNPLRFSLVNDSEGWLCIEEVSGEVHIARALQGAQPGDMYTVLVEAQDADEPTLSTSATLVIHFLKAPSAPTPTGAPEPSRHLCTPRQDRGVVVGGPRGDPDLAGGHGPYSFALGPNPTAQRDWRLRALNGSHAYLTLGLHWVEPREHVVPIVVSHHDRVWQIQVRVIVCRCNVEGQCMRKVGRMKGMPTKLSAVGILVGTLIAIGIFLILIFTHLTLARKKDLDQPVDSVPLKAAV
ncbi:cadherin-16 isoform X4 [Lagenorhynchus albirostris]|uniref:cadherin-16 isoform X4 n=1 Tax=Lagenorhynchus albirostris TaxID=27610 RepID=UPI0028ED461E|nr:cadherin-16 isoform X4 [Lagenorhynchus albirostris]